MGLFKKPSYSRIETQAKRDIPPGLWIKCKGCGAAVYRSKVEEGLNICPRCGYHMPLAAQQRIELLADPDTFAEIDPGLESSDPLAFADGEVYPAKLQAAKKKTEMTSAAVCGTAKLDQRPYALGVMDFRFMGASMGSVVGEKITRLIEKAIAEHLPLVVVTASGGARMHEGMFSLMQMAKTSAALAQLDDAGLPYIVIMTHPTTAGVTASFASLGDIILAEPGALVGFAGPRVIKQTTQANLPEGFQTAEFLLDHGFIDRVVHRTALRRELSLLLAFFAKEPAAK